MKIGKEDLLFKVMLNRMKIKNVIGSSKISKNIPAPYTCWRDYWAGEVGFKFEESTEYECPACGKSITKERFDGCHVQKANSTDKRWYIVPLCDRCNQRTGDFEVAGDLLVPVPSNL